MNKKKIKAIRIAELIVAEKALNEEIDFNLWELELLEVEAVAE